MSVPIADHKALWGGAAKRCGYRGPVDEQPCRKELVSKLTRPESAVILGEVTPIEGEKPGSAQYRESVTEAERNAYPDLILLCPDHHTLIDRMEMT